jgi:ligand-binding sensor domain-containing protein
MLMLERVPPETYTGLIYISTSDSSQSITLDTLFTVKGNDTVIIGAEEIDTVPVVDSLPDTLYDTANSELPENDIYAVFVDNNDVVWAGTQNGSIAYKDGDKWQAINTTEYGFHSAILSIAMDSNNTMWFGTHNEILRMVDDSLHAYDLGFWPQGVESVYSIVIDSSNAKWCAFYPAGLARFIDTETWNYYKWLALEKGGVAVFGGN